MDPTILLQSVHYILPVTIAILGLSIYLFGFQSVKEPDYSYINNIITTRKKKQQPVKKNGLLNTVVKPAAPSSVKPKVEATTKNLAGKENAQPTKKPKKDAVDDSADLEQGDWLPAPIRGASNRKAAAAVAKQQGSPTKVKATDSPGSAKKNKSVLKEVQNKERSPVAVAAVAKEEVVAQKKSKKEAPSKKELVLDEAEKIEAAVEEVVEVDINKNKAEIVKKVVEGPGAPDSPNLWEESKSRGNKKKARARKD